MAFHLLPIVIEEDEKLVPLKRKDGIGFGPRLKPRTMKHILRNRLLVERL